MVFIHRYKGYYLCNYDFGFALRQVGDNISMRRLCGASMIYEHHRHRYEVNNDYREDLLKHGVLFAGTSPDNHIVEMMEIPEHSWYVECQFQPEFKSRPNKPHPLFRGFVTAEAKHKKRNKSV